MPTIDADAHVVENEHTWDYMDPSDGHLRPYVVAPETPGRGSGRFWLIDGKVRGLRQVINDDKMAELKKNTGRNVETSRATRQMENVEARIQHMDELGIDIQVLQPTIFLEQVADRVEVEVALCRAYNRWARRYLVAGQGPPALGGRGPPAGDGRGAEGAADGSRERGLRSSDA